MLDGKGVELLITGMSQLHRVSPNWTKSFLRDLVESVGMTVIFGPHVNSVDQNSVTGFVVLAESHSSIHWTRPTFYLDLFSCKSFEVEDVVLWVTHEWRINKGYYQVIERGWNPKLNRDVETLALPTLPTAYAKST